MRMIFHHPLPVGEGAASASGVRPWRMLEAFRALGIEVDVVCGYGRERAAAATQVVRNLENGVRYALLYSESSTEPTLLTERHHLPVHPWLDFGLFARARRHGVPTALFYRDIYWRFPGYATELPAWKRSAARAAYRYDLWQYRRLVDRLYLPSKAMARHIPTVPPHRMLALPPACSSGPIPRRPGAGLRLLYVGGIGPHYRMQAVFEALAGLPDVEFTLCTREAEWQRERPRYALPSHGNVRVVHASGAALIPLYENCDVCQLCVEPHEYWTFAAPLKLYEYVGAARPVLASAGTHAAEFVSEHDVGWVVPYRREAIASQLGTLASKPELVSRAAERAARLAPLHTWSARARQVVDDLVLA